MYPKSLKNKLIEFTSKLSTQIALEFNTKVNTFGCYNSQEFEYTRACGQMDGSQYSWICYFVVPVDAVYKIILPTDYWASIKKFMSFAAMASPLTQFERDEYYSSLKTYEDIISYTEQYTEDASVHISRITDRAPNNSKIRLIDDIDALCDEIDDIKYLHLCFFVD